MIRYSRYIGLLLLMMVAQARLTRQELTEYQMELSDSRAYITSNGFYVNVLMPMDTLYQGKTTYLTDKASAAGNVLGKLIARSTGRVFLQGLLRDDVQDLDFHKSALYQQVSHLSEYLLSKSTLISYAPVVVNAYEKNSNYGIWTIFPEDEVFLNVKMIID